MFIDTHHIHVFIASLDFASLSNVALDALGPNGNRGQSASLRASAPSQEGVAMRHADDEHDGVVMR